MEHFCDNPNCPNHHLELNYEHHYHDTDENVVGAINGILKSHVITTTIKKPVSTTGYLMFRKIIYIEETKIYHFCDICKGMINFTRSKYDNYR